ncbi:MAG: hypothetical protein IPM16_00950 [Chloroflexi bacterium]|nr:hypothetical protein [Chloroflexota bacterium]
MTQRRLSLVLLSGGGLVLEICLTRLFSAVYYPPYVFTALALAVLGIGLGAAAATLWPALRVETRVPLWMALAGLAAATATVVFALGASSGLTAALVAITTVTYGFIGLALISLFASHPAHSPQLYTADLLGAGLGAVAAIPLMDAIGPLNGALAAAFVLTVAGYNAQRGTRPLVETGAVLIAFAALASSVTFGWLRVDYATLATDKPASDALANGGVTLESMWDSFARTDLIRPAGALPLQLYVDGAAGSVMPAGDDVDLVRNDIGFFAFAVTNPHSVMAIGPGGGLDVWFALRSGAEDIVAVEVNPASVVLVRDNAAYNGGLYDTPGVRVLVDEGRSVLRREDRRYDLISLSQVVTLAAELNGYALTENTVYTIEAFHDYFDHLTDDGVIAFKLYDEITLTRALSTALATLREDGLSDADAIRHTAVFLDPSANPPIPLLLVRRSAFTRADSAVQAALARDLGYVPLYLADALAQPPLDAVEAGTETFDAIIARSPRDISPPTDDRPFFFHFDRGLPSELSRMSGLLAGVVVVGGMALVFGQRRLQPRSARGLPLYFAALGVGFIAVEIALIQQTRLFLGHPTLAITTVLTTLLVGGGIGSLIGGRWVQRPVVWIGLAVAAYVMLWIVVWPALSDSLRATPVAVRVGAVVIGLLPLGLVMGMPFPLGLRAGGAIGRGQVALAWAVNGVMTVVGTVGSVAVAILAGFSAVLIIGVMCYLLVALLTILAFRHPRR